MTGGGEGMGPEHSAWNRLRKDWELRKWRQKIQVSLSRSVIVKEKSDIWYHNMVVGYNMI